MEDGWRWRGGKRKREIKRGREEWSERNRETGKEREGKSFAKSESWSRKISTDHVLPRVHAGLLLITDNI